MSVEFEVKQDALAVVQNTVIEGNFDEVKAALTEMVAPYSSMVVTEDAIPNAKSDRANLRKISARIDEVRKTVKKAYSEPLAAFESKCKELVSIISDGTENLDRQIKEFEQREADEKIAMLRGEYAAQTDEEVEQYLPWGCINNPKWVNKGYSYETAKEEIHNAIENTRNNLTTIRNMGGNDTPYLLDVYRETRDLSAVVRKASELKTMRQREELRAKEEADRAEFVPKDQGGKLVTVTFKVTCTKQQLTLLAEYMKRNGIKYGRT